jgi:hypothetical protein
VANPMCYFRSHVATVCRREITRCGKYARRYGTEDCVVSVDKVVCVNCRSVHDAGDRKCQLRERVVASQSSAKGVVLRGSEESRGG